jgi:hypothetical protein
MPVTPFHGGPALVVKALAGRHFSFGAFVATQVIIDIESISNILLRRWPVHAHLHTVVGSLAVAVAVIAVGKWPLSALNRWLRRVTSGRRDSPSRFADAFAPLSWSSLVFGAVFGGLSHIALDAMMHRDMMPLSPWSAANPLLIEGAFSAIHLACAVVGFVGFGMWVLLARRA